MSSAIIVNIFKYLLLNIIKFYKILYNIIKFHEILPNIKK
jgi:hypothetical protein